VFYSNKIAIRSTNDAKNNLPIHADTKLGKTQNFEHIMFRLTSFVTSFVNLPFKSIITVSFLNPAANNSTLFRYS